MIYFKRIYKNDPLLNDFIEECSIRQYKNNSSIELLKFDYFDYQAFFAGIVNDRIKIFSGVHNFDYNSSRYWRIGFRGVSLYDETFKPITSSNWRKTSLNMGVNFYLQMKWVENNFGSSNFVMTSNDFHQSIDGAGKSHKVDKLAKFGRLSGCSLIYENIEYLYTIQNVWLLDKQQWYDDFDKFYKGKIVYDSDIFRL